MIDSERIMAIINCNQRWMRIITQGEGKSCNMAEQCSDGWGSHFLALND